MLKWHDVESAGSGGKDVMDLLSNSLGNKNHHRRLQDLSYVLDTRVWEG
jgi:hypothetical protein